MVFKVVAAIPVYLYFSLCVNTTTVAQAFCIWENPIYTTIGLEDDSKYSQDKPQEY